jgi:hypothetical protein
MKKHLLILTLAISASAPLILAQDGKPPGDGPRPPGGRPAPPIIAALDLNKDGVIDAEELAKASESLKKLDKNGDGKLTEDEYRPQRPPGGPEGGRPDGPRGPKPDGEARPQRPNPDK